MTEHDEFLTALVLKGDTKPPLTRIWLTQHLSWETGKSQRKCKAVVNEYCDRNGIFPGVHGLKFWLPILVVLSPSGFFMTFLLIGIHLEPKICGCSTEPARDALRQELFSWEVFLGVLIVASLIATFVVSNKEDKRRLREADEARERMREVMLGPAK